MNMRGTYFRGNKVGVLVDVEIEVPKFEEYWGWKKNLTKS